jgi:hypothetical protein
MHRNVPLCCTTQTQPVGTQRNARYHHQQHNRRRHHHHHCHHHRRRRRRRRRDDKLAATDRTPPHGRYQSELDEQLRLQETQRREAFEQFQRDKSMIDEIVMKIQSEDEAEARRERERKQVRVTVLATPALS